MRKGINVHVYPSKLTHESRILRITDALVKYDIFQEIEIYGIGGRGLPNVEPVDARRTLFRLPYRIFVNGTGFVRKGLRTLLWSWDLIKYVKDRSIVCVNAHSLAVLPLCVFIAYRANAKLVYDTHELETETIGYVGLRRTVARWVEQLFIRKANLVIVVSDAIADWYCDRYAISRPSVVRNVPYAFSPAHLLSVERKDLGLPLDAVVFIYQGGFSRGRGIERLLRIFSKVPTAHLILMGSGDIRLTIEAFTKDFSNIHLFPAVSPEKVLGYTRLANVGICLTENNCLSHYFSLPNKIFEYLQAGLPILVNPLVEQTKIVKSYNCGWIAPGEDEDLINMLNNITLEEINCLRLGVETAAKELNWELEQSRIADSYLPFIDNINY